MESQGTVAISDDGRVQLEFESGGKRMAVLWERMNGAVLESVFNEEGAVLRQELHADAPKNGASKTSELLERFAKREKIRIIGEKEFADVSLNKPCPKCGKRGLKREMSSIGRKPVAVMPIYSCASCGSRSYHLTEEYLAHMVDSNRNMFDGKEILQLDGDRSAFTSELKEYVIRIFASKGIACIK